MSLAAAAPPLHAPASVDANDLRNGIGVNVHVEYTDGADRDPQAVLARLRFLGVDLVRDAAPNPRNQGQDSYGVLARSGIRFDLFVNGEEIGPAVTRLATFARIAPGVLAMVEGPNEINNHAGFSFAGLTDPHRAATAYQAALYAAVHHQPELAHTPVLAFTDYPATPGRSDWANFHAYPKGGGAPSVRLDLDRGQAQATSPGQPVAATEVGFPTLAGGDGVSELAQARLLLTTLLDDASAGVRATFIYQLLDAYPDPGGTDPEKHYGLFDLQGRPKPAAQMIRRLTTLLADSGKNRAPPIGRLGWGPVGPNVRRLVIRRSDGASLIAVWREVAVYDPKTRRDLAPEPEQVELLLPARHGALTTVDLVAGAEAVAPRQAQSVALPVGANPIVLVVAPTPGEPSRPAVVALEEVAPAHRHLSSEGSRAPHVPPAYEDHDDRHPSSPPRTPGQAQG